MANISEINGYLINAESASYATTASFALNGGGGAAFPYTGSARITGSLIVTGSTTSTLGFTGSLLGTASYAANGGVTQLLAGPNISLSPTTGVGQVTISSTAGGGGFNTATGSYGSFYDTTIQTNVASTARSMSLNTTDITNGVSISGSTNPFNTYIKVANAGVYDIQFSAQVDKTDSGTDEIWIWIRKNGTNLTDTATSVQLQGNGAHYVAAWNFFVNAAAGDYFQLMWYSPDANVRLHAEPAFGVVPGIPSLIVTANRVDQFLSNTGSFSGSFTGSLFGTASWATNALTASRILTQTDSTNANYFLTFVDTNNATPTVETLFTATNITINPAARSLSIQSAITGGVFLGPLTGSVFGTSSWATNALNAVSSSYAATTSLAPNYVLNSATSSFVTNAQTSSFVTNAQTSSFVLNSQTSSFITNAQTSSFVTNDQTSSFVLNSQTGSMLQPYVLTSQTSSFVTNSQTSSFVLNSQTSSMSVATASTAPNAALIIFGNYAAGSGFTNPIVTYLPFGTTLVSANETQRQIVTPQAGTLKNIYIRTNGAAVATSFTTFTIRVNGVATNVKINISGGQAAGLYSNIINSASVILGDEISLQISTSIANGPTVNQYSFGIFNT